MTDDERDIILLDCLGMLSAITAAVATLVTDDGIHADMLAIASRAAENLNRLLTKK